MADIIMAFDEYDGLCEAMGKLGKGNASVPTWKMIKQFDKQDITVILGLLVYLYENSDPKTKDEKQRMEYINRIISECVEFQEDVPENTTSKAVAEDDYICLDGYADKCGGFLQDYITVDEVKKYIAPYAKYCFALMFCLYRKCGREKEAPALLKRLMLDGFHLEWGNKPVEIKVTEFEKLKKSLHGERFQTEAYPEISMADIHHYIIPNFTICYDFVLWLLETAPEPKTRNGRIALSELKRLFDKNVRILNKNGERMETIWS